MISQLLKPSDLVGLPEHIEECLECGKARCIAFNPAGTLLASGCEGGEVVIWDCCTRGVARVYQGHRSPVVFVGWSSNGRRLVSASADGAVVLWDVLSGSQLEQMQCRAGMTCAALDPADEYQLLLSFAQGPAQLVDLRSKQSTALPVSVLETKKGAARVVRDPAEEGGSGFSQLAVLSQCGRLVFAATKGTVAVHRRSDMALLDLVVLQSMQTAATMSHGPSGSGEGGWLLMITGDKSVRAYQVAAAATDGTAEPHDPAELQQVNKVPKAGNSLLRGEGSALLTFQRQFQDPLEKKPWSCAAFSTDMEHVAGGMNNKHAIQRWNIHTGANEGTLEGGKDGVVAMAWHPTPLPMQLYTVGSNGTIYIWTKIERENWDCFAPDFEELDENREYVEREDEFDANPRPEDTEMAAVCGDDEEDEIVEGGWDMEHSNPAAAAGQQATGSGGGGEAPLRYLPVTAAEVRQAVDREQGQRQEQPQGQEQRQAEGAAPAAAGGAVGGTAGDAAEGQGAAASKAGDGKGGSSPRQQDSGAPNGEPMDASEGGGKRKRVG